MADTTATRADSEIEFCLAREEDYDDVMAISHGIYSGMDYLPARYHLWMKEPHRLVFLGKRRGRVIALESTLLVDRGETVIVEGLRVAPEERGRGVAGLIQSHVAQFIKTHYPRVRTRRLTRGDNPGPQALAKFRVLATRLVTRVRGALGSSVAVILNVYSDPALWEGLRELCEGAGGVAGGVRRYKEYWEQLLLETDF